jgi:hypothetical protein
MAFGPTGSNWLVMKYFGLRGGPLCLIKRPGVSQSPNCERLLKPYLVQTKMAKKNAVGGNKEDRQWAQRHRQRLPHEVMTVMTNGAHRCNCKDTRSCQELACAKTRIRGLFWRLKLGEPSLTAPLTYG